MGYLSQKKHQARENIFLYFMAFFLALLSCFALIKPDFSFAFFNLFHLYCVSVVFFIYALFVKKYTQTFLFLFSLILSYTLLSSSGNIFFSDCFKGKNSLTLYFEDDAAPLGKFSQDSVLSSGTVLLAHRYTAPYTVINEGTPITLLRVNFKGAPVDDYPLIFKHLYDFLLTQDNPVIIFGEFGIPVWTKTFKKFLSLSGLFVKNRFVFTEGSSFNIFSTPQFYILGFKDLGISHLTQKNIKGHPFVSFDVSFTLE